MLFDRLCANETETRRLVRAFYEESLRPLPDGAVLLLDGEMGSGKTTFCRLLGEAMGISQHVNSPTFNLLHQHRGPGVALFHYDLYRLDRAALDELEFPDLWRHPVDDCFTVHAIEWWSRAGNIASRLPIFRVELTLEAADSPNGRRLRIWRVA